MLLSLVVLVVPLIYSPSNSSWWCRSLVALANQSVRGAV